MKENRIKNLKGTVVGLILALLVIVNSFVLVAISRATDENNHVVDTSKVKNLLELNLEKYKNYNIDGEKGLIVQLDVKTGIEFEEGEEYTPLSATAVLLNAPKINNEYPQTVTVVSKDTKATNGSIVAEGLRYSYDATNGEIKILTLNEADENGSIYDENNKGAKDNFKVVLDYGKNCYSKDKAEKEIEVKGTLCSRLADKELTGITSNIDQKITLKDEVSDLISADITSTPVYNGFIKANAVYNKEYETNYTQTYEINISKKEMSDETKIEIVNNYGNNEDLFVSSKLEKANVLSILGNDGNLKITDAEGKVLGEITKDTEVGEDGTYEVKYPENTSKIYMVLSKIKTPGIIKIKNEKKIAKTAKNLEINEIQTSSKITSINKKEITTENNGQQEKRYEEKEVYKEELTSKVEIGESKSKVNLTVDTKKWTNEMKNDVNFEVELPINSSECNLFKNPSLEIKLPQEVKKVILNTPTMMYANGLTLSDVSYNEETKTISVALEGEQQEYLLNGIATGTKITIPASILLNQDIESKNTNLVVNFTNEGVSEENATENGETNVQIRVENFKGPIATANVLRSLNVSSTANAQEQTRGTESENGQEDEIYDELDESNEEEEIDGYEIKLTSIPYVRKDEYMYTVKVRGSIKENDEIHIFLPEFFEVQTHSAENLPLQYVPSTNAGELVFRVNNLDDLNDIDPIRKGLSFFIIVNAIEEKIEKVENSTSLNAYATAQYIDKETNTEYTSETNVLEVTYHNISINMEVQKAINGEYHDADGEVLKPGDIIRYIIKVKNLSSQDDEDGLDTLTANIVDSLPLYLDNIKATYNYFEYNDDKTELIEKTKTNIDIDKTIEGFNEQMPNIELIGIHIPRASTITITIDAVIDNVYNEVEIRNNATVSESALVYNGQSLDNLFEPKVSNTVVNTIRLDDPEPDDPEPDDPEPDDPEPDDPEPDDPEPDNPEPDNPEPDNPEPDNPEPDNPEPDDSKGCNLSGLVWDDQNEDGIRQDSEEKISDVTVYLANKNKNIIDKTQTSSEGRYEFKNLEKGEYLVVFRYDNSKYKATKYKVNGASEEINSDAVDVNTEIKNEKFTAGVTDIITVASNVYNIDMGLISNKTFDFKIDNYISNINIKTENSENNYDYDNVSLAKAEIKAKEIEGAVVKITYKIIVTNNGEVPGTINSIADTLPRGFNLDTVNSNLWVKRSDGKIINTSLANKVIDPGKSVELTLVATITMTENYVGTFTNSVEINSTSNEKDLTEINTSNNSSKSEVIISISTGVLIFISITSILAITILVILNIKFKIFRKMRIKIFVSLLFVLVSIIGPMSLNNVVKADLFDDISYNNEKAVFVLSTVAARQTGYDTRTYTRYRTTKVIVPPDSSLDWKERQKMGWDFDNKGDWVNKTMTDEYGNDCDEKVYYKKVYIGDLQYFIRVPFVENCSHEIDITFDVDNSTIAVECRSAAAGHSPTIRRTSIKVLYECDYTEYNDNDSPTGYTRISVTSDDAKYFWRTFKARTGITSGTVTRQMISDTDLEVDILGMAHDLRAFGKYDLNNKPIDPRTNSAFTTFEAWREYYYENTSTDRINDYRDVYTSGLCITPGVDGDQSLFDRVYISNDGNSKWYGPSYDARSNLTLSGMYTSVLSGLGNRINFWHYNGVERIWKWDRAHCDGSSEDYSSRLRVKDDNLTGHYTVTYKVDGKNYTNPDNPPSLYVSSTTSTPVGVVKKTENGSNYYLFGPLNVKTELKVGTKYYTLSSKVTYSFSVKRKASGSELRSVYAAVCNSDGTARTTIENNMSSFYLRISESQLASLVKDSYGNSKYNIQLSVSASLNITKIVDSSYLFYKLWTNSGFQTVKERNYKQEDTYEKTYPNIYGALTWETIGGFRIQKVDQFDNYNALLAKLKKLKGFKFQIFSGSTLKKSLTTGDDGTTPFTTIANGTYSVSEISPIPSDFVEYYEGTSFPINCGTLKVETGDFKYEVNPLKVKNKRTKTSFYIQKEFDLNGTAQTGLDLSGFKFKVYDATEGKWVGVTVKGNVDDGIIGYTSTYRTNDSIKPNKSHEDTTSDNLYTTFETNTSGITITLRKLPLNHKYHIYEVAVGENYESKIELTQFALPGKTTTVVGKQLEENYVITAQADNMPKYTAKNNYDETDIKIIKTNEDKTKNLSGVKFKILNVTENQWVKVDGNGLYDDLDGLTSTYTTDDASTLAAVNNSTNKYSTFITNTSGETITIKGLPIRYKYKIYEVDLGEHKDIYDLDKFAYYNSSTMNGIDRTNRLRMNQIIYNLYNQLYNLYKKGNTTDAGLSQSTKEAMEIEASELYLRVEKITKYNRDNSDPKKLSGLMLDFYKTIEELNNLKDGPYDIYTRLNEDEQKKLVFAASYFGNLSRYSNSIKSWSDFQNHATGPSGYSITSIMPNLLNSLTGASTKAYNVFGVKILDGNEVEVKADSATDITNVRAVPDTTYFTFDSNGYKFKIASMGQTIEIQTRNYQTKTTVYLHKTDFISGQNLSGVKFKILEKSGIDGWMKIRKETNGNDTKYYYDGKKCEFEKSSDTTFTTNTNGNTITIRGIPLYTDSTRSELRVYRLFEVEVPNTYTDLYNTSRAEYNYTKYTQNATTGKITTSTQTFKGLMIALNPTGMDEDAEGFRRNHFVKASSKNIDWLEGQNDVGKFRLLPSKTGNAAIEASDYQDYITLRGYVWEDGEMGKGNTLPNKKYLSTDGNDRKIQGIIVRLKDKNNNIVKFKTENRANAAWVESTKTNSSGEYVMYNVSVAGILNDGYYIEFSYDGITYEAVKYTTADSNRYYEENTSKANETATDRNTLNNKFTELNGEGQTIDGKKITYKKTESANDISVQPNNTYASNWDRTSRPKTVQVTAEDSGEIKKFNIVAKISNTLLKDYYNKGKATHKADKTFFREISSLNLGVYIREQIDLRLDKDGYAAYVSVNGKNYRYKYLTKSFSEEDILAQRIATEDALYPDGTMTTMGVSYYNEKNNKYSLPLRTADVMYKHGDGSEEQTGDEMDAKLTYVISLTNNSSNLDAKVNEITEIYSSKYNFNLTGAKVYTDAALTNAIPIEKIEEITDLSNATKTYFNNAEYKAIKIRFKEGIKVDRKSSNYLFIQFDLPSSTLTELYTQGKLYGAEFINHAEISSYTIYRDQTKGTYRGTYAGYDNNSIPNNLKTAKNETEFTNLLKENDADSAPGVQIVDAGGRTISGYVFKDNNVMSSESNEVIGNGIRDTDEKGIMNAQVLIMEVIKNSDGTESYREAKFYNETDKKWEYTQTSTGKNGSYMYLNENLPAGDYVIQFKWGDSGYSVIYTDANGVKKTLSGTHIYEGNATGTKITADDYKSTIVQLNRESLPKNKWFLASNQVAPNYSEAKEKFEERVKKEEQYNVTYSDYDNIKPTTGSTPRNVAIARTNTMEIGIEATETTGQDKLLETATDGSKKFTFDIKSIDLGLIERPNQAMGIRKTVDRVKIVNKDGLTIVDAEIEEDADGNRHFKNTSDILYAVYLPFSNVEPFGMIKAEIDKDMLPANMEVTYSITVENTSQEDYKNKSYYYYGHQENKSKWSKNPVRLQPTGVYDYMTNSLRVDESTEYETVKSGEYTLSVNKKFEKTDYTKGKASDAGKTIVEAAYNENTVVGDDGTSITTYNWKTTAQQRLASIYVEWAASIGTKTVREVKLGSNAVLNLTKLEQPLEAGQTNRLTYTGKTALTSGSSEEISSLNEMLYNNTVEIIDVTRTDKFGKRTLETFTTLIDEGEKILVTPPTGENRNVQNTIIVAVTSILTLILSGTVTIIIKKKIRNRRS